MTQQGYTPGDHRVTCDVCGLPYRRSEVMERWDGVWVCTKDFEQRHPQDLVRPKHDKQTVYPVRPNNIDLTTNTTSSDDL